MPKLSSLVNLSTAGKVAGGVMLGGISTAAVQLHTDSSEFSKDPQRAEMREEQKKLDFEVQQRSEELEKKEQELKALEATLAKQQAALREERSTIQQMQQAAAQGVASETAVVETVQQVVQAEEPTDVEPEKPKADVVQVNNTPKRPAVFDGGNKEKPVATTNKNNASEPSVAFGSSGDVVTIEKGGADSSKEEELRKREERLLLAERRQELKRLSSDEDGAFAESDAFDFDPSGDKKKVPGKYMKRIENNPVDFQISKQEYSVSANPTKGGGVATTKTPVSTPKSSVPVGKEEINVIKKLFDDKTVKNISYLPKETAENTEKDAKDEGAIRSDLLTMNKASLADEKGYIKTFSEQFPEFNTVHSYGVLKNIAEKIVSNIENLPKDDENALQPLSREEVFEALQRSVKDSGARYLKEKMEPPSIDPALRTACEDERKGYREMVAEITVPERASDPAVVFGEMRDKAEKEWKDAFDDACLLKGKRDILQGWFDLCNEMDPLDFGKIIAEKKTGDLAVPPPPPPPPPVLVLATEYELPSKRNTKSSGMPSFKCSAASDYDLKIVEELQELDPNFKQMDDALEKNMIDLWNGTELDKTPGKTDGDKKYEKVAKQRDAFWRRYFTNKKYHLLGLQHCVCSLPKKQKEVEKEGGKKETIEHLDLPKYDDVEKKAKEVFGHFGSLDPTNPLDKRRAQIFGLLRDDNEDALKKAYLLAKRFMNLIDSMEKMRKSYRQKKSTYDAGKSTKFDKESNESYTVSVPSLESLESDKLYEVLSQYVHKIHSLEIKSVGKDARFTAFERFLRLCRSMDHLKTLKITAPWGSYADKKSFFHPNNSVKGSVLTPLDPQKNMLTNEEQLLGAIAVIPNLEEIHLLRKAATPNASLPLDSFEHYWAAVGNCTVVELPIFTNGPTLLRRICQSDDLKTKKRHFILTAYEGTSILEKLSDGLLEVVGQLLMAGKGKVTVQFGGSYTSFAKWMKIREPLRDFYHDKTKGAKPLLVEWMEEETDERWPEFLEKKEIALGEDPAAFLTQKEITLDMFQNNIGTFMEISSVVTIEWANEVSDAFFGKKKNSKYTAAYNFGYFSEAKTIEEYKKEQQELLIREKTKGIREKAKEEEEQWRKAHSTVSDFQRQLKKLPIFLPGQGIEWMALPKDEKRYPVPFYYLSPLVLAASLHLDADNENYYFFNVKDDIGNKKDNIGTASFDLVFPGIADGPLFRNYRKVGKVSATELANAYQVAFSYGKKFTGKACSGCTATEALKFSEGYDTIVSNEIRFYDVLRPYLPPDFNKKPKIMQLLAKLKLKPGVTIRHQKRRRDGEPTEEMIIELIRTLKSGFEIAEKLKPMEKTIGEYKKSLFDLNVKEIDEGALSPSEKSQKTKLEKDIDDLGKARDPLASTLKDCCVFLQNQESYIRGLMEMIRIYGTRRRFCRVELDGTIIEDAVADPFSGSSSPFLNSFLIRTTTAKQNQNNSAGQPNGVSGVGRPRSGSVSSRTHAKKTKVAATAKPMAPVGGGVPKGGIGAKAAMFGANPTAPKGGMASSAFTYSDRVQKWKDNGRKIKYVSFTGVVSDHIQPDEKTAITLPLSASDPKTAKALKKGEEPNKDAVERFILSGDINIVEEKDPSSGLGTGKYYVRFTTVP